jgi:hypothetical protein
MVVVPVVVTLGVGLTVITTVEVTTVQGPPASGSIELRVKVTVPVVMEGVYVDVKELAFEKLPDGADHIPVLAPPEIEPVSVTEPPEQTGCADPALTTAAGLTVTTTLAVLGQPALVSVYVYVPAVLVPGTNVPKLAPVKKLGPNHAPPVVGKFSKELKRLTLVEFEQTVIAPLVPALGSGVTVIIAFPERT